ncbi:MAG: dTDP-glucose 4,6-dehydratase [Candidatus Micrarchaeia archaeon]
MKLLVTGGLGFIGSNFIKYWFKNHRNDTIINIDKLTYAADPYNLYGIKDKYDYTYVKGDIANKEIVLKAAKDVDVIINFAAETHVDNSIKNAENFVKSNVLGVYNLLEVARIYNIRFHQVSTDEVYGMLPLNSKSKFTEKSKYAPRNPYSATKAGADHLVNAYFNTYKLPVTISNCSNNYGPYQHPEKLIPKAIINALFDKPIPIYGNGMQIRDWIYVDDHCSALERILLKGEYGETYLISANQEKHNIDVVKMILNILNKDESLIKFVGDRPGHDVRYAIDARKIRKELGWKPKMKFDEGLKYTTQYYIKNFEHYKDRVNL